MSAPLDYAELVERMVDLGFEPADDAPAGLGLHESAIGYAPARPGFVVWQDDPGDERVELLVLTLGGWTVDRVTFARTELGLLMLTAATRAVLDS